LRTGADPPGVHAARHRRRSAAAAGRTVAGGIAIAVAILSYGILHRVLDVTKGTPLQSATSAGEAGIAIADPRFVDVVSALSHTSLEGGHQTEFFFAGPSFYPRLYADLRGAERSISFQPYYCGRGVVADSITRILAERAAAGVTVRVVADGFGCSALAAHYGAVLRRAGVEVVVFRPVRWYAIHRAQHRSHARIVVLDGAVAWTGGFGVDDKWLTADGVGWRETNVRFTGPAVAAAQAAFLVARAEATGHLVADGDAFPGRVGIPDGSGGQVAGVQYGGPGLGTTSFERMLFLTIGGARDRLYITNAYFVPSAALRVALIAAARRGVDVRLLTAGAHTDVATMRLAARASYAELLRAGVRIYEYAPTMMHAKTIVADGHWVVAGAMNLDNRSLRLNDELNLLIHDSAAAASLEQAFRHDLLSSREINAVEHAQRSWTQRLLEHAVNRLAPLL
jgi:cardiolipin synthase A/B